MIEYIKLCMVPFLVSSAFTWIITLNVCIAEKYDGKTERKIKCKKMLMVCPYFVKYTEFEDGDTLLLLRNFIIMSTYFWGIVC